MKRSFIFVLVLFATLSMVNAVPTKLRKRITKFTPCAKTPIDVTKVEPDPLIPGGKGKFYVSGSLAAAIPKGYVMAIAYFDVSTDTPKQLDFRPADICQPNGALACPYPANTPFDIIFSGGIPTILPDTYGMVIAIGRIGGENLDIMLGCAAAIVNGGPAPAGKAPPAGPPPGAPPPAPAPAPPPAAPSAPPPPPPPAPPAPSSSAPSPSPSGSGGIQDSLLLSNIFIGDL